MKVFGVPRQVGPQITQVALSDSRNSRVQEVTGDLKKVDELVGNSSKRQRDKHRETVRTFSA